MDSEQDALEYYRSQCDTLGAQVLRLRNELTEAHREGQRNRTLALLIQELHRFAQENEATHDFAERLGEQLLMLMIERFRVDRAALLSWRPELGTFVVDQGVGIPLGAMLAALPQGPDPAPSPAEDALETLGLDTGICATARGSGRTLLLGHRRRGSAVRAPIDAADRLVAEAAIKVYDGLLSRHAALHALRDSEANYRALFEGAQDAILVLDLHGMEMLDANRKAAELFGGPLDELRRQPPGTRLIPADPRRWRPLWKAALRGHPQRSETQVRAAAGRILWVEINLKRVARDKPLILAMVRDISARKQAEDELQRLQERLHLALEGAEVGLYDIDLETRRIVYDDRFVRILGGDPNLMPKTVEQWWSRIHPEDLSTVQRIAGEALAGTREKVELEYRVPHQAGGWIWLLDRGKGFDPAPSGRPRRAAGTCVDITERKVSEASIHRLAYYDPLTDLPNRRLLLERLANAQATAQRDGHIGAVLFLDLDRFKQINDARGHEAGDHLLQEVAARLRPLLRPEDTVARFGGDEFVILMSQLTRSEPEAHAFAHQVAERIRQALAVPFQLSHGDVSSAVSIGVTLFDGEPVSIHDILREADTALYRAKEGGRNCIHFFEPSMQQAVEARFDLEEELRQALGRNELQLYYQPQMNANARLIGAEALLRWRHPVRGMISPAVFVPLAEETGLILSIGHWVLTQACQLLARLARDGHTLSMSVNVSPRQFRQPGFVEQTRQILIDCGVQADRLVLEITEGVVIDDIQGTIAKLRELKALGARISIDDFGTGYSSLTYLKRLPIDELKIDRSFVQDICLDSSDAALIEAIVKVCKHLGLVVVAEGVETSEQLDFLLAHGCETYQGYLFGMPASAETLLKRLEANMGNDGRRSSVHPDRA